MLGLALAAEAQIAGAASLLIETITETERPCPESVVLNVCADSSARSKGINLPFPDDDPKEKLRQQFLHEQRAERFRIDYQNAHPDETLIWGKTVGDTDQQGIRRFAATVKDGVRPDCMNAYSYAGLLALPFILHDLATDTGCH